MTAGLPPIAERARVIGFTPISKPVISRRRFSAKSAAIPDTEESIKHLKKCLLLSITMSIMISEAIIIPKTVLLFTLKINTTLTILWVHPNKYN